MSPGHYDDPVTQLLDGVPPRALADRCPGLLRAHRAEDGALVRLRLPGGQTDAATLLELSRISTDLGEGSVQLTSRGNLQLRGLDESRLSELVQRVSDLGLLPSVTHERVRNIVASPLTGLDAGAATAGLDAGAARLGGLGGLDTLAPPQTGSGCEPRPDLRPLVRELDRALCAAPELAELPGRFLFALDDGRGDVLTLGFDLALLATGPRTGVLLTGGSPLGVPVALADAVDLLVELARRFVRARAGMTPPPWHVAELVDAAVLDPRLSPGTPLPAGGAPRLGAVAGAASVGVPLSLLDRRQIVAVDAAARGGGVVVTPWRGLVIPGAAGALGTLAEAGLVVAEDSPWSAVTACIGAPGCAKSAISTRDLATDIVRALRKPPAQPVHLTGCVRRCGAPATEHVALVAPESLGSALAQIRRAEGGSRR